MANESIWVNLTVRRLPGGLMMLLCGGGMERKWRLLHIRDHLIHNTNPTAIAQLAHLSSLQAGSFELSK
jgi:hypothetical protein